MKRNNNSINSTFIKAIAAVFLPVMALTGCGGDTKEKDRDSPVARVMNEYLYFRDLEGIAPKNTSASDSARLIERYIDTWVKKQLLIKEAQDNIEVNKAELERKLLDYKYALLVYEYEKQYINDNLQENVSAAEIKKYYNENKDDFLLNQNIIRCIFIKVTTDAPKLKRVREIIGSEKKKEKEELKSYCYRYATTFFLEDSDWVNFDDVVKNTPLVSIPDKVQFLKRNKFVETTDDEFTYLLYIKDYVISEETSPLDFVKDQIKNIIINKRKLELTKKLEQDIYNRAKKNNDIEIYK